MAEREGFEPSEPVKAHCLSKAAHSATLPPLRAGEKDSDGGGPLPSGET